MSEYRRCMVDGELALFHRWAEIEDVILKFDCMMNPSAIQTILETVGKKGYIGSYPHADTEKIKAVMGIVEFEDGSVKKVKPESITFLDSKELFDEFKNE